MANRREARQSEIELSQELHELASREKVTSPSLEATQDRGYIKSLIAEILTEELEVDPEVHAIFQEAQAHVLVNRSAITGSNISYQLLDDGFAPKNPLCHREAFEEDYSEESLP